ncbi:hypothetical protein [Leifsonia sp. NPDC058230]|uniref:hypothetical protein n=1 Tax=Leifsonia sp. NPDC058230 TaxID=3346391 RepID=UPI0036DB2AB3
MILDETSREPGDPRGADTPREQPPASGSNPDIDPNYDPAFQRGYRPQPGERLGTRVRNAPATGTSPYRRPVVDDEPAAAPLPTADRGMDRDLLGEPETEDPLAVQFETFNSEGEPAVAAAEPVSIAVGSILDRVDVSPRRNPFFLALWILGGGFIVLGIVLYAVSVYTSYTASSTELDLTTLVFSQIGWMLAGPLVTVGLATIVALVLLTALRSRPKTPSPERD